MSYTFTVTATDGIANSSQAFSVTIASVTSIAPTTMSFAQGSAASYTLSATDNKSGQTFTYSISAGTLPTGVSLSGAVISGTPTVASQIYSFSIKATDTYGASFTQAYSGTVTADTLSTFTQNSNMNLALGVAIPANTYVYTSPVTSSSGLTVSYSVTSGSLPPGVTISSTGVITGTPTSI